jgi:hypothetical protein
MMMVRRGEIFFSEDETESHQKALKNKQICGLTFNLCSDTDCRNDLFSSWLDSTLQI